ncbi:hypothetical protein MAR_031054 [Mya arenaria]|uniref:Uncharacterized protein n=1 Tax=Mya arenaria TaxID=6604 RepID=A0ABY7F2S1_MYAAR|nr:hypothetical protein MAR_031054 [Mya arenaria]
MKKTLKHLNCDIRSGECKYGCLHGTHGSLCSIECDQKCIVSENGVRECRQMDGQCTLGCEAGYKLTTKGYIEEIVPDSDSSNGVVETAITGGVIAVLSVSLALSVGYNVFMKRRQNREHPEKRSASGCPGDDLESIQQIDSITQPFSDCLRNIRINKTLINNSAFKMHEHNLKQCD